MPSDILTYTSRCKPHLEILAEWLAYKAQKAARMFRDFSDDQLREYEERLYDDMVAGDPVASELHDDVVVEMNKRGMMEPRVR